MGVPPTPSIDGAAGLPLWLPGAAVANDIARSQTRPLNDEPKVGRRDACKVQPTGKSAGTVRMRTQGGRVRRRKWERALTPPAIEVTCPIESLLRSALFHAVRTCPSLLSRSAASSDSMLAKALQGLPCNRAIRSHEQQLRVCERWCSGLSPQPMARLGQARQWQQGCPGCRGT